MALLWLGVALYRGVPQGDPNPYRTLSEGEILPETTPLLLKSGERKQVKDFRGQVVLINFWAGWCGPCLKEMPSIYKLYDKYKEKGFTVLAVNMDDDLGQGIEVLKGVAGEPPFPVLKGVEEAIYHKFPIEGLPYTVILDKSGLIKHAISGELDWISKESQAMVEALL